MLKRIYSSILGGILAFYTPISAHAELKIDNQQRPYMIVDKSMAHVFVYSGDHKLIAQAPALIGQTLGDVDAPVAKNKKISDFKLNERITPSGRFQTILGKDLKNQDILWFNYDSMLAIHSVNQGPSYNRRFERLASTNPKDKRVTLGCVVLEPKFFKEVVLKVLGQNQGILYILSENEKYQPVNNIQSFN